jgi:hypothetical protein
VSPREFDGAVASEVHEHFDADGNLTGTTVVTRESMWDDEARGRALRLAEYEASICPKCGLPMAVCHDPDQAFAVHDSQCYGERAIERVEATHRKKDHEDDWWRGRHFAAVPHDIEES